MKETQTNAAIAIATVVGALIMLIALSFTIGKWSMGGHKHEIIVRFPVASGLNANSEVKYAGAPVGRVKVIRIIARKDQTEDPFTKQVNSVEVVAEVDPNVEIGDDCKATIKQDGLGISARYLLFTPGPDPNSKLLADDATVQGEEPFELNDLIQPAGEALTQARNLLTSLEPSVNRLDSITQNIQPLMSHADKLMTDGDQIVAVFNTPDGKEKLKNLIANLNVATENLKVVSSNAKAFTATIAQKPWRVFWGGGTVPAPPEDEVLKSDTAIPLQNSSATNKPSPHPASVEAPANKTQTP
jgi:ABC-type transporter Mla subunit MlaD